jgi:hypothetical protein
MYVGLKVDADVKRGKTIHVPDSVYKKGCIWDAKHGVAVSQSRYTLYNV